MIQLYDHRQKGSCWLHSNVSQTRCTLRRCTPYWTYQRYGPIANAPDGRTTVGQLQLSPNSRNVIPGQVRFTVDMRHPVASTLLAMAQSLRLAFDAVREDNALKGNLEQIWYSPPTAFDPACVNMVEQVENSRGHSYLRSSSGAGYDAKYMADICPTAMVFIPCKDGLSHNELEDAAEKRLISGSQVLLNSAFEKAMEPE